MSDSSVRIEPGFRGTVTGLTRAAYSQRATVTIKDSSGRTLAMSTFVGKGENVPMHQEINPSLKAWSFGPFNESMTVTTVIEFSKDGSGFAPSKSILPITVRKDPDPESPQTYVVSTLLSEDAADHDWNDAIVSVFQFK